MSKLNRFFARYQYGLALFFVLCVFLINNNGQQIDEDSLCAYVIGYNTGFGGRKLVGTVVNYIFQTPTIGRICNVVNVINITVCFLFSLLCNNYLQVMRKYGEGHFAAALYLVALYMLCPAAIMFLLVFPNYGRLDILLYLACLVFCVCFKARNNNRLMYFVVISILICLCILAHHIFVTTYFSFFVALAIYDIWGKGFNKYLFRAYTVIGLLCIALFFIIIKMSTMNVPLDAATHLAPNIELSRKFVCFGYYAHITDHIEQYILTKYPRLIAGFTFTTILLAPLFFAFSMIWRRLYLLVETRDAKILIRGMLCAFLLFVPAFFVTVDYPRWFGAFIFTQFLLIAYLTCYGENEFEKMKDIIISLLSKHKFYATALLLYCSLFGYFYSDTYFACVESLIEELGIHRVTTLLPLEYRL